MKKLKVLYIIDTLEGYGAEKSLVEIASNFQNIIPVFVHIYQGDMLKPRLEEAGVRVYSLDLTKKYAFNTAVKKLKTIYSNEKPDIVHATLFRSEIIARKLKKIFPEIYLVGSFVSNAYSSERFWKKDSIDKLKLAYFQNLDRQTSSLVDKFISNSQTIKKNTAKALEIELNKVEVIYRGRKSSNFDPKNVEANLPYLNNGYRVLLNVSRLIPLKGQLDLLKALPAIIEFHPDVVLVFAGHGSYRENLERHARKLGVLEHIKFLGRIDNIQKLLMKADIFLYPSYSEGLPGALIEAMMAQRIIIASNIPENLECVDENSAVIFEKGNIPDLISKILLVLKNPKKYLNLGVNARKVAIEKFELAKVVGQYENFYVENFQTNELNISNKNERPESLRILHLIQKPQQRGAETFASQLARHQKLLGQDVRIVSIFSGTADLNWAEGIISLEASSHNRFLDFKAWRKLNLIIQEFRPDVVQANAGDTLKYSVISKKIFKWDAPIFFRNASEVGRYLTSKSQILFNKYLYKNIDTVLSVSQASKNDIIATFPFLKSRVNVVPIGIENGVEVQLIELKPLNKKHIVHVGGFTFEKNHTGLFDILKEIRKKIPDVHIHLLGDGPLREQIQKQIKEMNLQESVTLYGFVSNPLQYIKSAEVLVLPSIIEGLPGVILEAMFCETPVVAYDVGGISEVLSNETGYLIPPNDESKFVKAVIEAILEKDQEKIKTAKNNVQNNYLNSEIAKKFISYYRN